MIMVDEVEKKLDLKIPDEVREKVLEDSKINEFNLLEECRDAPNKTQRYIEAYYIHKRRLEKLNLHLDKVSAELFKYYKTDYEIKLTSSQDVWTFIKGDKRYQTAAEFVKEQEAVVDFYEKVTKNMNGRAWALRDMVKIKDIEGRG
jgi:D-mannonate dehydratase